MTAAEMMLALYEKLTDRSGDLQRHLLHNEVIRRGSQLLQLADELAALGRRYHSAGLCAAVDVVREQAVYIREMAEGILRPFMLFVVGMGKYGKSTLINAIVGARVAEMDALPKTWKIDIFSAAQPDNTVRVRLLTGEDRVVSVAQAKAFLAQEEEKRLASEDRIDEEFRERSRLTRTVEQKEALQELLRDELLYRSPVSEVHWPAPASPLLRRFDIVDTPGVIQTLDRRVINDLRDYYHKADGVLWMLDATKVSARKARELIDELESSLASVGGYSDNIVAVLNRMDLVNDGASGQRVLEEAYRIFGDRFREIVPFSAKQALHAVGNDDEEAHAASGLNALVRAIERHFLSCAISRQMEARTKGVRGYVSDAVSKNTDWLARLRQDNDERQRRREQLDRAADRFVVTAKSDVKDSFARYREDVNQRIENLAETLFYIQDQKKRNEYVRSEIFASSDLARIQEHLGRRIQGQARVLLEEHYRRAIFVKYPGLENLQLPAELTRASVESPEVAAAQFDTSNEQFLSGLAAGGLALALLGPVGLLVGALAFTSVGRWVAVQFKLPGLKSELRGHLNKMVETATNGFESEIDTLSTTVVRQVTRAREESFASVHCPAESVTSVFSLFRRISDLGKQPFPRAGVSEIIAGRYRHVLGRQSA
jgi:GTPase SAR1 family protein